MTKSIAKEVTKEMAKIIKNKRQKCEIYSRSMGYLRPVSQWNVGKKAEFRDRKMYNATAALEAAC